MSLDGSTLDPHPESRKSPWLGLVLVAGIGLASLLAVPVEKVMPIEGPPLVVRALATLQPTVLAAAAIALGLFLAPKVALSAPYLFGAGRSSTITSPLGEKLFLASLVAAGAGYIVFRYGLWSSDLLSRLDSDAAEAITALSPPLITRILYGGLTEEIISRWGVMTLFVWLIARFVVRRPTPPNWVYWAGASIAALLFALGHLPLLFALVAEPPAPLIVVVVGLNAGMGLAYGWLFWRAGLEAAMVAHAATHVVAEILSRTAGA
jgi:membrane protease YdiL (CAAX protease family)